MRLTSQNLQLSAVLVAASFLSLASGEAEAQQAPFCVVTPHGQQCWYYDAPSCRRAAEMARGMCVPNQGQSQQPNAVANVFEQMERGAAEGQRMRLEREQAAAQIRLLEAQAEAARQAQTGVIYRCPVEGGGHAITGSPAPGCVVLSVRP